MVGFNINKNQSATSHSRCKHCKQLEPEMEGAAAELEGWGVTVAKVDGTREKELADQYNVAGWPTIKMFRRGRVYEYMMVVWFYAPW